eukprot:gb/GFBE01001479.1/.p1 GENE.gb/GFBE01001479.1/~~gb/GFBE01001479.1/.p1  ORF type:complete len:175 (+),score=50.22 gb/GFBE01001479.1/:1-525(+)
MAPSAKMMGLLAASLLGSAVACQDVGEVWLASLVIFGVIGGLLGLIFVVLSAVPLCCGAMKGAAKPIAAASIVVGILACFVPLIGAGIAAAGAVSTVCDSDCYSNGCTDEEKQALNEILSAYGVVAAYFLGLGWLAIILGIVAASLGCCILCKCCKMKDEVAPPQVQVIGQPVK